MRVISSTGYRWSFGLEHARQLLLATRVGGEQLSTATARRAGSSRPGAAASSGSNGSTASRSTRTPTLARCLDCEPDQRSGAGSTNRSPMSSPSPGPAR